MCFDLPSGVSAAFNGPSLEIKGAQNHRFYTWKHRKLRWFCCDFYCYFFRFHFSLIRLRHACVELSPLDHPLCFCGMGDNSCMTILLLMLQSCLCCIRGVTLFSHKVHWYFRTVASTSAHKMYGLWILFATKQSDAVKVCIFITEGRILLQHFLCLCVWSYLQLLDIRTGSSCSMKLMKITVLTTLWIKL